MAEALRAVKGMNDVLPPESARWEWFEDKVRALMQRYAYANVRTPIVEPTALFVRGLGEVTDIVEKEMYSFEDAMNGDRLSLRPENTAGVVRAVTEHSFLRDGGKRLFYIGPMFRHERPQKGRYRQFHQLDVEALGFAGPDVDAEQIVMLARLWRELGLADAIHLEINSIGDGAERRAHRSALVDYFTRHADALDADSRRRLSTNPLRILDSKNPALQDVIAGAPRLVDRLELPARTHFEGVTQLLADAGIAYIVNPRLVRGLDYYNRTVFEWVTDRLGAQGTVAGGGRYDGLFEELGGKATPACGFAMGIERMILLLQNAKREARSAPFAYLVHVGDAAAKVAQRVAEQLRDAGHPIVVNAGGGSFKAQMKRADASGARFALIVGDDEAAAGTVAIKPLREAGEQHAVALEDVGNHLSASAHTTL
jgi:histidyl-tRNA synthetase